MQRKSVPLIVVGLSLLALSAAWFLTPLQDVILGALGANEPPSRDLGGATQTSGLDVLNTGLNALNAVFAALGVFFAAKGYRLQPPKN